MARQDAPSYKKAGVSFSRVDRFVEEILPLVQQTRRPEVMKNTGRLAGLFALRRYRHPVLVSSTDGVGTKLRYALKANRHEEVGVDCVAMNVNDIITFGAEPLFFLDYVATGRIERRVLSSLVRGISRGCREAGCALISGETAEMPGFFGARGYDVAGFAVGIVEKEKVIDGRDVAKGDMIVGLASSGFHSNGFSLIRKIYPEKRLTSRLAKGLLKPTRIYVKPILALSKRFHLKAISHITGGGLYHRVFQGIPSHRHAILFQNSWPIPKIFRDLQRKGRLDDKEMFSTFNMGIGMTVVCSKKEAGSIQATLRRFKISSWIIGEVVG